MYSSMDILVGLCSTSGQIQAFNGKSEEGPWQSKPTLKYWEKFA
jgi:hypothetical protein